MPYNHSVLKLNPFKLNTNIAADVLCRTRGLIIECLPLFKITGTLKEAESTVRAMY